VWIGVVTLFPEMFDGLQNFGVVGRAIKERVINFSTWNPRDYAKDKYKTIDDRPFGGGAGMLLKVAPILEAINDAKLQYKQDCYNDEKLDYGFGKNDCTSKKYDLLHSVSSPCVIYLSPQGRRLDQQGVKEIAKYKSVVLLAGRYEGVDERLLRSDVDEQWSIGDYVLSGGEPAAVVLIDAVARTLPGVLGHADSVKDESFENYLLDYPHYTRPQVFRGQPVPSVLLSGDHKKIKRWRLKESLGRTWLCRPDLLKKRILSEDESALLEQFIEEYEESGLG